ncbi:DNA repair protein XRCC3-like [Ctenocephalides felis]|uniref:DNA repair protein XRCC3-like n=1 Tax=Ctenocephalides felis TaxID=7515 RepID=UPI000E6E4CDD|nr:DNA repair protein XRCC3-like [Ctenocephalides felis]
MNITSYRYAMEEDIDLKSKLPNRLNELLQKVGIETAQELILKSDIELQDMASFSSDDLKFLKKSAAEIILHKMQFSTGLELYMNTCHHIKKIKIGCPLIDRILDGGLTCRGITEISGESGTGKTQICLQLCIMVQYPEEIGGLNAGAVYICTEDVFPSKRLQQLFQTFPVSFAKRYRLKTSFTTQFADNIYIEHASDAESLVKIICNDVPRLMANKKIGLVVIDSIAAVFRIECVSPKRSNMMRSIALSLHKLAKSYESAIICVNQYHV